MENELIREAVRAKLSTIGEAVSRIPQDLRQRYPENEWHDTVAFRSLLAREYFGISWIVVWETVEIDLPKLRKSVQRMLDEWTA